MFAISFDLIVNRLKADYGQPYNNAYYEIGRILRKFDFYNVQGSVYMTTNNDMSKLFRAMEALKKVSWFKSSVRDIRAFRVEDWSDFSSYFKE